MNDDGPIDDRGRPEWTVALEPGLRGGKVLRVAHFLSTFNSGRYGMVTHIAPVKSLRHMNELLADFPEETRLRFLRAAYKTLPKDHV